MKVLLTAILLMCHLCPLPHHHHKQFTGGHWQQMFLTGYSVCDTPGLYMADGTYVFSAAGLDGAATAPTGYYGHLPFGTREYIPSIRKTVTIHDTGAPSYFIPSPYTHGLFHTDVYFGRDCSIGGNFRGLGSHVESVYLYN